MSQNGPKSAKGDLERWIADIWRPACERSSERKESFATPSGLELQPTYGDGEAGGMPGEWPYTRGIRPTMYRGRLWTMRQYAGFTSARETNQRFRLLLDSGQTGLSTAFDLPTQIGYDSDDPLAIDEVGNVGVPINSLRDMELLFEGIPLDEVWEEVQHSNMQKLGGGVREDGKILKPDDWEPPHIAEVLAKHA